MAAACTARAGPHSQEEKISTLAKNDISTRTRYVIFEASSFFFAWS